MIICDPPIEFMTKYLIWFFLATLYTYRVFFVFPPSEILSPILGGDSKKHPVDYISCKILDLLLFSFYSDSIDLKGVYVFAPQMALRPEYDRQSIWQDHLYKSEHPKNLTSIKWKGRGMMVGNRGGNFFLYVILPF